MKIGIIDDDINFINVFKEKLYPRLVQLSTDNDNELLSSTHMIETEELNSLDIVFFDIQLNDKNSIDLIVASKTNFDTKIVFLSSKNNLVFDSFKVKPLTFIRKNNLDDDFDLFLELFKEELTKRKNIKLQFHSRAELVPLDKIQYIIACGHDITVVTSNKEYHKISSLKKVLTELNDNRYIQIQKSICINLDYVKEIEDNNVILKSGKTMSVSRYFRKNLRKRYLEYLLKNYV